MAVVAAIVFALAAAAHTVPFPFLLEAFRPSQSVWHVKQPRGAAPVLYFTFDDGPHARWTPPLLDALGRHGVRATFFLIDEHVAAETAPIVKRMADEGHAIALHSGSRRQMTMSPTDLADQLTRAAGRVESITERPTCRLFRPHAGWRSASMYQGLELAGYRLAGWSWGMWDWDWWQTPHANRIAERLAKKASGGDIIVIHDGHHADPEKDRRHAAETIDRLVPLLRARGFSFGTLCDQ